MNLKELINKGKRDKIESAMVEEERLKLLFGVNRYSEKEKL
jgi:hypothetical protein